jgi:hypothetical protein
VFPTDADGIQVIRSPHFSGEVVHSQLKAVILFAHWRCSLEEYCADLLAVVLRCNGSKTVSDVFPAAALVVVFSDRQISPPSGQFCTTQAAPAFAVSLKRGYMIDRLNPRAQLLRDFLSSKLAVLDVVRPQ